MPFKTLIKSAVLGLIGLGIAAPATAQGVAGSYLAAQHASRFSDYRAAADYYARALVQDPSNPALLENAIMAYIGLGQVDRAVAVSRRLISTGATSQIAAMALLADQFQRENYEQVLEDLEAGQSVGPLVDGLLRAWAQLGMGSMSDALASFDEVSATQGIEIFGHTHKALALGTVGDFEGA